MCVVTWKKNHVNDMAGCLKSDVFMHIYLLSSLSANISCLVKLCTVIVSTIVSACLANLCNMGQMKMELELVYFCCVLLDGKSRPNIWKASPLI